MWKEAAMRNLRHCIAVYLEALKKYTKKPSQDSLSPVLNTQPSPEKEAGIPPT
jgi:hypothetical protein